jgi:hypothetical protein
MSEISMVPSKWLSRRTSGLLLVGAVFAFGASIGLWASSVSEDAEQPWPLTVFATAGVLFLLPTTVLYSLKHWGGLDEAAQEAHKWAWYWGGSIGLFPGLIVVSSRTLGLRWAEALGFDQPRELIVFGALTVIASALAGYLIAWSVWWARRR